MKNKLSIKALSLLLVAVMMLSIAPFGSLGKMFATTASGLELYLTEGFYSYTLYGYCASITGVDRSISGDVTIPSTLGGYPVTGIENWAFSGCYDITSITVPKSVTYIGEDAFFAGENLTSFVVVDDNPVYSSADNVLFNKDKTLLICYLGEDSITSYTVPDSVTGIGAWAFENCSLTCITIPNSVTSIGKGAFNFCVHLTDITLPDNITCIEERTFEDCFYLPNITIPNGVTSIGEGAFKGCFSLTSISIPSSVKIIEKWAFAGCNSITNIEVADDNSNYSSVNGVLFNKDKTQLLRYPSGNTRTNYDVPNGVTEIYDSAFSNSENLTTVNIPDGVTSIGDNAFYYCSYLTNVTLPDSVTHIGVWAFSDILHFNDPSNWENGALYIGNHLICGCSLPVSIKEGTLTIADGAFKYFWDVTEITIPNSVKNIGARAFASCSDLERVTISNSLTSISEGMFSGCSSLERVTIPDGVICIGNYAFENCVSLKEIFIPGSVTSIGEYAFNSCESLPKIIIPDSVTSIGEGAFSWCDYLSNTVIPNSVTVIGERAFIGCNSITDVTIPSSVTNIGERAFNGCNALTSIKVAGDNPNYSSENGVLFNKDKTKLIQYPINASRTSYKIPNGVTEIGNRAFGGCNFINEIILPNSVVSIGEGAFCYSSSLYKINIPDSVRSIGWFAFSETLCYELYYNWENDILYIDNHLIDIAFPFDSTSCTVKEGTITIADGAFNGCVLLEEVTIPNSVKNIGKEAFVNCHYLKNISIPTGVTSIGEGAFREGYSLSSISIAHSVTNIGKGAFSECCLLKDVYFGAQEEKWNEITIGEDNEKLTGANIHFADYTNAKLPVNEVKKANYKNKIKFKITATGIPEGGFLTVDGEKFAPDANGTATFEKEFQVKETTIIKAHISDKNDNFKVTAKDYTIKVDSYFFAKVKSFFTDFLFNWFKWKEVEFEFK